MQDNMVTLVCNLIDYRCCLCQLWYVSGAKLEQVQKPMASQPSHLLRDAPAFAL